MIDCFSGTCAVEKWTFCQEKSENSLSFSHFNYLGHFTAPSESLFSCAIASDPQIFLTTSLLTPMMCDTQRKKCSFFPFFNIFFEAFIFLSFLPCFISAAAAAVQVWMCGGELMISTCSHVGHVFRKSTPYVFPGGTSKIVNHNNARLAEVWLDQWKEFYFSINPGDWGSYQFDCCYKFTYKILLLP